MDLLKNYKKTKIKIEETEGKLKLLNYHQNYDNKKSIKQVYCFILLTIFSAIMMFFLSNELYSIIFLCLYVFILFSIQIHEKLTKNLDIPFGLVAILLFAAFSPVLNIIALSFGLWILKSELSDLKKIKNNSENLGKEEIKIKLNELDEELLKEKGNEKFLIEQMIEDSDLLNRLKISQEKEDVNLLNEIKKNLSSKYVGFDIVEYHIKNKEKNMMKNM